MKIILLYFFILTSSQILAQENLSENLSWKQSFPHYFTKAVDSSNSYTVFGDLISVIPTGKRRQSYEFTFALKAERPSELLRDTITTELWSDYDGMYLLQYLDCNNDLPYVVMHDSIARRISTKEFQPCLRINLKLTIKPVPYKETILYFLIDVVRE